MNDEFEEFAELIGRVLAVRWLKELENRRDGAGGRRRRNKRRAGAARPKKLSKRRPASNDSAKSKTT